MARILVIGGANVDIKGQTNGAALMGTSNPGTVSVSAGGVGRNIAHNLALLGVDVSLLAMVGTDHHASVIEAASREAGVDVSLLQRMSGPSGTYLALLDSRGELVTAINAMAAADGMTVGHLENHERRIAAADLIVADCNNPVECLAWIVGLATKAGKPLIIEPVSLPKIQKLRAIANLKAFAVTPNRDQILALTGQSDVTSAFAAAHALGLQNIVMHAGPDGAYVSKHDGTITHVPARFHGEATDVTGAGDAAVSGLVWGLLSGYDIIEAARFGQVAAALKLVSKLSVAETLSREKLLEMTGRSI